MSEECTITTISQPSLYDPRPRKINIYLDIPDKAADKKCDGILLLIAGFGGHAQSNVFKKMRRQFADEYNLITVQCDYFGYEFMQAEMLKESPDNFCDMGPVQAMDHLIALKVLKDFLEDNNISYDERNVIAYGFSHGGYLALIMNAFMPGVLSCIIDNSAWISPKYLVDYDRIINNIRFNYLIHHINMDAQIYDSKYLYSLNKNKAFIVSFHGVADTLVSINEKISFASKIDNMSIEVIGEDRVDHVMFNHAGHGLGADFLKLFCYAMKKYRTQADEIVLRFEDRDFATENAEYHIRNEDGIPILYYHLLKEYDYDGLSRFSA